jgi:hypothetical protein
MRCPKCGKVNYGEVSSCYACGEPLSTVQEITQHRYGPCPHCGNPQAEYFAGGRGQCRACVRTFDWKEAIRESEKKPEEEEQPKKRMMIVVIIIAVVVVAAGAGAWFLMSMADDDDGGGDEANKYIKFERMFAVPANPSAGDNVTIDVKLTFKEPSAFNTTNVHVELWWSYTTRSTSAIAQDHREMEKDWLSASDILGDMEGYNESLIETEDPVQNVGYKIDLNFNDVAGAVTLVAKVFTAKEYTKPEDRRAPLAESDEYTDVLVYA